MPITKPGRMFFSQMDIPITMINGMSDSQVLFKFLPSNKNAIPYLVLPGKGGTFLMIARHNETSAHVVNGAAGN